MTGKTISIGIPAYNEGSNIAGLLKEIIEQKTLTATIKEIIVVSDGSTDNTVKSAKTIIDSRIKIIENRERKGKSLRQNQILAQCSGDYIVLLDADIALFDVKFIQKLIEPLGKNNVGMTSAAIRELPPRTFFEHVLDVSMQLKDILFATFKDGSNVYRCHGPARAFIKNLSDSLTFSTDAGEDMYSYFFCVSKQYAFTYVESAIAYYRLPNNFSDHKRQSIRYLAAKNLIKKEFGTELFEKEMHIPLHIYIRSLVKSIPLIVRHPIRCSYYLLVLLTVIIISRLNLTNGETWNVTTSKVLRA